MKRIYPLQNDINEQAFNHVPSYEQQTHPFFAIDRFLWPQAYPNHVCIPYIICNHLSVDGSGYSGFNLDYYERITQVQIDYR